MKSISEEWLDELAIYCDPEKTRVLLIGNKMDLDDKELIKPSEVAMELAKTNKCRLEFLEMESERIVKMNKVIKDLG